jgi:acyl-CoA synthetase (AMP-forming)/AMP-acid ligase II
VVPGSGQRGMLAIGGRIPVGYYKDAEKTRATFRTVGGARYSLPGDWATVDRAGRIELLGRGSLCINTGGEKVFPEEVEEAVKRVPGVVDAVAVGVPDERFGEIVTVAVEVAAGSLVTEEAVVAEVRRHLAAFKAPRRVRFVDAIGRSPAGKADYTRHRQEMVAWLARPGRRRAPA